MKKIWNKDGIAILRKDGTLHHPESKEGKRITQRVYGKNSRNIKRSNSIYDKDGGFYLE